MMTDQTVDQLLHVFRLFRERYERGESLHKAYREAVREVAKRHGVTYQTIGDGCRRRLKLDSIRELYDLLSAWIEGRPEPLADQLKKASHPASHGEIDTFFGAASVTGHEIPERTASAATSRKFAEFSFQLPERDARMLRALAEIEGVTTAVLLRDVVATAVAERMRHVAQAIVRESQAPIRGRANCQDIINVLRRHEAELHRLGVEHLSVFGSAARGDLAVESDIDLAVRFLPGFSKGGFDYFGRIEDLRERLTEILDRPVDVIEEPAESERLQKQIDEEGVVAF